MFSVFAALAAVLEHNQFFGGFGFVFLGDVVEVTTNGAFQAE